MKRFKCPDPQACFGGSLTADALCGKGSSGVMCIFCGIGYARVSGTCVKCSSGNSSIRMIVGYVGLIAVLLYLAYCCRVVPGCTSRVDEFVFDTASTFDASETGIEGVAGKREVKRRESHSVTVDKNRQKMERMKQVKTLERQLSTTSVISDITEASKSVHIVSYWYSANTLAGVFQRKFMMMATFYQIITLLPKYYQVNISESTVGKGISFEKSASYFSFINLSPSSLLVLDCFKEFRMSYYQYYWGKMFMPPILLFILCVTDLIGADSRIRVTIAGWCSCANGPQHRDESWDKVQDDPDVQITDNANATTTESELCLRHDLYKIWLLFLFIIYPSLCSTAGESWGERCLDDGGGGRWLMSDYSISCNSEKQLAFAKVDSFFMVLYNFGIPLYFLLVLFPHREAIRSRANGNEMPEGLEHIDMFCLQFEGDAWYWIVMDTVYKYFLCSFIVLVFGAYPTSQIMAATWVCLCFNLGVLRVDPYIFPYDDTLAFFSGGIIMGIFIICVYSRLGTVMEQAGGNFQAEMGGILGMPVLVTIACIAIFGVLVYGLLQTYKEWREIVTGDIKCDIMRIIFSDTYEVGDHVQLTPGCSAASKNISKSGNDYDLAYGKVVDACRVKLNTHRVDYEILLEDAVIGGKQIKLGTSVHIFDGDFLEPDMRSDTQRKAGGAEATMANTDREGSLANATGPSLGDIQMTVMEGDGTLLEEKDGSRDAAGEADDWNLVIDGDAMQDVMQKTVDGKFRITLKKEQDDLLGIYLDPGRGNRVFNVQRGALAYGKVKVGWDLYSVEQHAEYDNVVLKTDVVTNWPAKDIISLLNSVEGTIVLTLTKPKGASGAFDPSNCQRTCMLSERNTVATATATNCTVICKNVIPPGNQEVQLRVENIDMGGYLWFGVVQAGTTCTGFGDQRVGYGGGCRKGYALFGGRTGHCYRYHDANPDQTFSGSDVGFKTGDVLGITIDSTRRTLGFTRNGVAHAGHFTGLKGQYQFAVSPSTEGTSVRILGTTAQHYSKQPSLSPDPPPAYSDTPLSASSGSVPTGGLIEGTDETTGRTYYYNRANNTLVWDKPHMDRHILEEKIDGPDADDGLPAATAVGVGKWESEVSAPSQASRAVPSHTSIHNDAIRLKPKDSGTIAVSGAGSSKFNGIYSPDGNQNGHKRWRHSSGGPKIYWKRTGYPGWRMVAADNNTSDGYFNNMSQGDTPPTTWNCGKGYTGEEPAPTSAFPTDVGDDTAGYDDAPPPAFMHVPGWSDFINNLKTITEFPAEGTADYTRKLKAARKRFITYYPNVVVPAEADLDIQRAELAAVRAELDRERQEVSRLRKESMQHEPRTSRLDEFIATLGAARGQADFTMETLFEKYGRRGIGDVLTKRGACECVALLRSSPAAPGSGSPASDALKSSGIDAASLNDDPATILLEGCSEEDLEQLLINCPHSRWAVLNGTAAVFGT